MEIKIAFLCLAHNNFTYLEHLSHYYCSEDDGFFVHIDSNVAHRSFNDMDKKTVILSPQESYRTRWGTLNIIQATLALLTKAMQTNEYNRFILVSGADTPLITKLELKEKLSDNLSYFSIWQKVAKSEESIKSKEFFNRHFYNSNLTNPGEAYLSKSRTRIYTMLILNKLIARLPNRQLFSYPTYAKGSQWWCLTKELAEYVTCQLSDRNILAQFKNMHAPDEKVFQTIAINSPFTKNLKIDQSHESLKQGLHYVDWGFQNGSKALQSFTLNDVEQAKGIGCAFARKVESRDISSFISFFETLKK
jgi:hypothetical protein